MKAESFYESPGRELALIFANKYVRELKVSPCRVDLHATGVIGIICNHINLFVTEPHKACVGVSRAKKRSSGENSTVSAVTDL